MFALKGAILSFFGLLMLLGSPDLTTVPGTSYTPVDSITASDSQERSPLYFDDVLDVNHSFTFETPPIKIVPQIPGAFQNLSAPLFYQLSYYAIGQKIMVKLSTKAIIFPFHCFT